jgi:F-type H+-transporting ATPase subunit b
MNTLVAPTINLVILLSVLFYYLRAPLKNFVSSRHTTIRDELAAVEKMLRDAKAKYQEFSKRLDALSTEASELRAQAAQEAQAVKTRLIEEAKKLSANIVTDAKSSAEGLYSELRGQLYAELSQQVLERAEKLLAARLTGDDRARIQKEFSHQLEITQ